MTDSGSLRRGVVIPPFAGGSGASAASKADAERLLRGLLPFAEQMLIGHGQFYPYGAALTQEGEIVPVTACADDAVSASAGLLEQLRAAHRDAAGRFVATATVYEVSLGTDAVERVSDAIAIELDHETGQSLVVFLVYAFADGGLLYRETIVRPGAAEIFPHPGQL